MRDEKNPSRAETPLYKGIPEDLGRDEGFYSVSFVFITTKGNALAVEIIIGRDTYQTSG